MRRRAYETAQRLATDPGATEAERANAAQRCREYEARHPNEAKEQPASDLLRDLVESQVAAMRREHDEVLARRRRQPKTPKVPWWALKIAPRDGPRAQRWLGNTVEFRQVLRAEKNGFGAIGPYSFCNYTGDAETLATLDAGLVDWAFFPEYEDAAHRWRPPPEMKTAQRNKAA